MLHLLNGYCKASKQQVNVGKSRVFFSPNTPLNLRNELGVILGMTTMTDPGKYLRLPHYGEDKKKGSKFYEGKAA